MHRSPFKSKLLPDPGPCRRARPRNQKYSWRSGNTTYFEDRHFEVTVIFDDRIKLHFVKVEATLAAYAHLSL